MSKQFLTTCLISFFLFLAVFPTRSLAVQTNPNKYVRTANYFLLSGPALDDEQTKKILFQFDLLVLPAEAQIFNPSFFKEARKTNPDIIILAYVPTVSFNNLYWSDALHIKLKKGIDSSWWLQDGQGNKKSIWPNTSALNISSGWADYLARFVKNDVVSSGLWDGIFYDEVSDGISWVSPVDTNQDGKPDSASEANDNWNKAYQDLFSKTRSLLGKQKIIITNGSSNPLFAPYINGRMFESFPTPWEGDGSWTTVMNNYLSLQEKTVQPPIFILNSDTSNTGKQYDYRCVRFGITSTLLGNGYFGFDFGTENHGQLWQYDEYQAYLGKPKEKPDSLSQGIWKREFEQGKVLVNSTKQTQTIRLGGEFEKLHGTQDTKVNNGSIVSQVTLPAQDGIILLRPIETIYDSVFINGSFVRIFDKQGQSTRTGFFTYDNNYRGGQQVVYYDIDNDNKREILVANDSSVTIYNDDGSFQTKFYPYTQTYQKGINLAVGDLENDGTIEIVTGTEQGGGPQIRIFNKDGNLIHPGFFAYDTSFRGGVNVAIGDLNGDNTQEIIAGAGIGGGPHVRVFNKDGHLINPGFFAYDTSFRGGVNVAVGDLDGDQKDEIITGPGTGSAPEIRVFDKDGYLFSKFFAFDTEDRRGVEVSVSDIDGDKKEEIIGLSRDVFTFSSSFLNKK